MIDPLLTRAQVEAEDAKPATKADVALWGTLVCALTADYWLAQLGFMALAVWILCGSRR